MQTPKIEYRTQSNFTSINGKPLSTSGASRNELISRKRQALRMKHKKLMDEIQKEGR